MGKSNADHSATRRTRKSRSASKPTTPLNRLRGAVGDRKNWIPIWSALDSVKNDGPAKDFDRLYAFGLTSAMAAIAVPAAKPVRKSGQIQSIPPFDTTGIHKEVAWVTTVIAACAAQINRFIRLREAYCAALSSGCYDEAGICLDKIDSECGLSLWSVENRISLTAVASGFERQKEYVGRLIAGDRRSFVAFFASNVGERNETRVSKSSFEARLKERAKSWKLKSDQQTYIFYKLVGGVSLTPINVADILSFEAASSAIDLYETFLDLMVTAKDSLSNARHRVLEHLTSLHAIADPCLDNLRLFYSDELPETIDSADYLNAFLCGEYTRAASLLASHLADKPDDPIGMFIAAKLRAMEVSFPTSGNPFLEHLLSLMVSFLQQGKGNDEAAQALERIAMNFRSLPIAWAITDLVQRASSDIVASIPAQAAVRTTYKWLPIRLALMGDGPTQQLLEKQLGLQDATSQYAKLAHLGIATAETNLSLEAKCYAAIRYSEKLGRPRNALPHLEELSTSGSTYFRQESRILRAWFLHSAGDIYEAILHTVRSAIASPTLLRSLPIVELLRHRGFRELKQLEREPCLSIGFLLYANVTRESTKDVALKVAWKQFHKAHRLSRPSELKHRLSDFDRGEILYFLRNVCTQEIMELSAAFNSPADLDKERLQICIALSELDAERSSDYDAEIIELTRRLSIEEGVQQVESSRVYVDVLGLQRWCHQHLGERFLRYLDYVGAGLEASLEELERSIIVIAKKVGADTAFLSFLDAYDISSDSLLAELIEECAAHFLTLPRFGLDAFLGSRVRHGSLEGAFRSPLEARKLITKIDSTTGQYETNVYWLNADSSMSSDQRAALNKALNAFSSNIDALLDAAISRFVHVRSTVYPDGLIWLWPVGERARRQLLTSWLIQTKSGLSKEVSIDQLVEFCATTLFWPNLKPSLSEAAEYVASRLAGQITEQLDLLEAAACKATANHGGITACISAARTDIETAAVKASKWFAPPQFTSVESSYLLKTAIEIGLTSLRHLRPQFTSDVEWDIDERANVLLHATGFQTINDVAFLIFGNIQKHSGFFDGYIVSQKPRIQISLRWVDPNVIEVEVLNEIARTKDVDSIESNVLEAKNQIRLRQFDSVARQKNKTGLVRLASVLNYESSDDKVVEFGLVEGTRFRVQFSVPVVLLSGQHK